MATTVQAATTNIYPFMSYDDAPAAIKWLVATLGFEAVAVYPGQNGRIDQAELRLGQGWIMLSSIPDDQANARTAGASGARGQGVAIYVEDVDAHYERACATGAEIMLEIRDTHYGARDYMVRDPEGHHWSIGNYRPGRTPTS